MVFLFVESFTEFPPCIWQGCIACHLAILKSGRMLILICICIAGYYWRGVAGTQKGGVVSIKIKS